MHINLHIGVHKTATTYIQDAYGSSVKHLNACGVGYLPLAKVRSLLTKKLFRTPFRIEDHLRAAFPYGRPDAIKGLIISDENLPGSCKTFIRGGQLYPSGDGRLAQLRELLPDCRFSLFVAIRSYDTFATSAYCEALRPPDARFTSFQSFRKRIDADSMRWPALISKFAEALRPEAVQVWRYEDFRQNAASIMRAMAFGVDVALPEHARNHRASFSQVSVDILHMTGRQFGKHLASRLIVPVVEALPKGDEFEAYQPWSDGELEEWRALYEADCRALPSSSWLVQPRFQ